MQIYEPGGTLRDAVQAIETGRYVLPAIQRGHVWRPDQICRLFDSIMRGIPFGTFLFWRVEPKSLAREFSSSKMTPWSASGPRNASVPSATR
jgi:hypothetical protein